MFVQGDTITTQWRDALYVPLDKPPSSVAQRSFQSIDSILKIAVLVSS